MLARRVLLVHIICQLKISDQSRRTRMASTPVRDGRRAAIVTGGATGVGAATAVMLARRGYDIAIMFSKSRNEAEETAALCRNENVRAIAIQGSVAENAACKAAVDATVKAFGRVDALVNSAGATQFVPLSDLDGQNAEDFQKIYAVNVIGPYQ